MVGFTVREATGDIKCSYIAVTPPPLLSRLQHMCEVTSRSGVYDLFCASHPATLHLQGRLHALAWCIGVSRQEMRSRRLSLNFSCSQRIGGFSCYLVGQRAHQ